MGVAYIFNEEVFRTTSFGISPNGVLDGFGMNGGRYPDMFAGNALFGVGVLVAGGAEIIPAASNFSNREPVSGTGVGTTDTGGGLNG